MDDASRFKHFIHQIFSSNPADLLLQSVAGAFGAVVSIWAAVNPFVGIYLALVVIDTIFGVRLSIKQNRHFRWRRLLYGPGEKVIFGALILMGAQFMHRYIPGEFLSFSMAAYMSGVLFLEAAGKYDKLTGYNILGFIQERISTLVKRKPKTE